MSKGKPTRSRQRHEKSFFMMPNEVRRAEKGLQGASAMPQQRSPFRIESYVSKHPSRAPKTHWQWRLWAANKVLLLESPRTYDRPSKARRALAATLKRIGAPAWHAASAEIVR